MVKKVKGRGRPTLAEKYPEVYEDLRLEFPYIAKMLCLFKIQKKMDDALGFNSAVNKWLTKSSAPSSRAEEKAEEWFKAEGVRYYEDKKAELKVNDVDLDASPEFDLDQMDTSVAVEPEPEVEKRKEEPEAEPEQAWKNFDPAAALRKIEGESTDSEDPYREVVLMARVSRENADRLRKLSRAVIGVDLEEI